MVIESSCIAMSSLFIITCTGGTIGRETELGHAIVIPDPTVSKVSQSHSCYLTELPRLRSTSSQRYERARMRLKFGERSFSCAGPRAWNSLPSSLQELTDTKTFKRKLKTFLFQQAYH